MHCPATTTKPFYPTQPQVQLIPSVIPTQLLHLLITYKPDWTSWHWTALWNTISASPKHKTLIHISSKLVPLILHTSSYYTISCEWAHLVLTCGAISTIPLVYRMLSVSHKTPPNILRAPRPINGDHAKAGRSNQGYQVNTGKVRYSKKEQTTHHISNFEQHSPAVAERESIPGSCHAMGSSYPLLFWLLLHLSEKTVPSDAAFDPSWHLTFQDISVDQVTDPQLLRVHLRTSKTDPFHKAIDVFVGRTGNELCPVTAMLSYILGHQDSQARLSILIY